MDDILALFELTPEQMERQRQQEERRQVERKRAIQEAVQPEHLAISTRCYKKISGYPAHITLFLTTKKGVNGEVDTIGKLDFTLHEDTELSEIFVAAKKRGRIITGREERVLHVDRMVVYSEYRQFGLARFLLDAFLDHYEEHYKGCPVSIEYMNPVAEYAFQKALKERKMQTILSEKLIQRYYYVNDSFDDVALIQSFQGKDATLFPLDAKTYIATGDILEEV